jgi:hypothetical protein
MKREQGLLVLCYGEMDYAKVGFLGNLIMPIQFNKLSDVEWYENSRFS